MMSKKKSIEIKNYEIKPSRRGEKMEILLKSDSSINESTKNIEVSEVEFKDDTPEEIELAGLQLKHVYARVSVNLRVQKLADLETVRTGKQKQDVYVADHSSTAKVTLWEEQVGILHDQTSYKLENFVVREFGGTTYLSMGSESKVIPIEEIKDAKTVAKDYESMLEGAQIVAVSQFGSYKACMRCGARVEPSADNSFGRCSIQDCMMLQKVDFCTVHMCAKLMLMAKSTAYNPLHPW